MQLYLLIDGEKRGPFTVYEVAEEVRAGRATEETLGWHKGADGWLALEELGATSSIFVEPPPRSEVEADEDLRERRKRLAPERARSSVRLWARLLDLFILAWVVQMGALGFGFLTITEVLSATPHLVIQLLPAVLLVVMEGFTISLFGTTPGKWLLRVKVEADGGGKIPLGVSFYRALTVWWRGVGLWLLPLNIIMMAWSQAVLLSTGKTPWDRECGLHLTYGKIDRNRVFLIIGVLILLFAVMNLFFGDQFMAAVEESRAKKG